MIEFRYLRSAEQEMVEAAEFYNAAADGLGPNFLDDIQRTIDRVRKNPQLGQPLTHSLRRMLASRFPFTVIYAQEDNAILVVGVAHHRRRPGYWQTRVTQ